MAYIEARRENIPLLTYDVIDCMAPGDADEWAEDVFEFDYASDQELKQKLKLHVTKSRQGDGPQNQFTASSNRTYKEILNEEREKRKRLIDNLSDFENAVRDIRNMAKNSKNQTIARIQQTTQRFEEVKNEFTKDFLDVKPNPIFITGETSAGKSSFINLLLKDDIMPVDFDRSSSTFCYITKYHRKKAIVHFKASGKKNLVIENLGDAEFNVECQKYLATKKNDVAFVELMSPSDILKDDVIIMDSPGMGDPDFSEGLKEKIKDACAFVYVLKHFNPIAVDCWDLADLVKNACKGYSGINNDAMVFIVNKWDTVQRNKTETYKSVFQRLQDYLGQVSESRVLTMSVRDARFMQSWDVLAEDYSKFLDLLYSLQISAITNKTRKFHSLVVDYMNSIVDTLDFLGQVLNTDMKKRQEKADILDQSRERISTKLDEYHKKKNDECNDAIERRTKALRRIMRNDENFKKTFMELMTHTIPYAVSPADMDNQIVKLAAEKLSRVLEVQEQKDHFLNNIREKLLSDFFSQFHEFEVIMKQSKQDLFVGRQVGVLGKDKTLVERALPHWSKLTLKQKVLYGVAMPVYAPFIVGVYLVTVNAQILSKLYKMLPSQPRLVTLEERKAYISKQSSQIYQRYAEKEEYLRSYVKEIMKDVEETLENLYRASKKQLENLRDDARVLREENDEDNAIIQSSKTLQRKLSQYLSTLYRFEFECLQYERVLHEGLFEYDDEEHPLSWAPNSAIYGVTVTAGAMGDMKEMGGPPTNRAALKRVFWKVMADDVQALHTEIQLSIIHSKNANLLHMIRVVKSPPNCEVINVSLLCEAVSMSFRSFIHANTPSMDSPERFQYLRSRFADIQGSLLYLHSCDVKGTSNKNTYLTGYELNLDTVMVTVEGRVKLMNLKLPGPVPFPLVCTQDGVHCYRHIPPPVILADRIYDAAADLYSMGIAQYEAWFHAEAFLEFTFDRTTPKDNLLKFADMLRDPAAELSNGQQTDATGSDIYMNNWFNGTIDIISDYMNKKATLTTEAWPNYIHPL